MCIIYAKFVYTKVHKICLRPYLFKNQNNGKKVQSFKIHLLLPYLSLVTFYTLFTNFVLRKLLFKFVLKGR